MMRRLPPSREPAMDSAWPVITPKLVGLAVGLLLGYLLFPGGTGEPAAAPPPVPHAQLR